MKDLFIVNFGVERTFDAWVAATPQLAWLLAGPLGKVLRALAKEFLARAMKFGVLKADLTIDAVIAAHDEPKYRQQAYALYAKTLARVYTDEEKEAIRRDYIELLRHLGRLRRQGANT